MGKRSQGRLRDNSWRTRKEEAGQVSKVARGKLGREFKINQSVKLKEFSPQLLCSIALSLCPVNPACTCTYRYISVQTCMQLSLQSAHFSMMHLCVIYDQKGGDATMAMWRLSL